MHSNERYRARTEHRAQSTEHRESQLRVSYSPGCPAQPGLFPRNPPPGRVLAFAYGLPNALEPGARGRRSAASAELKVGGRRGAGPAARTGAAPRVPQTPGHLVRRVLAESGSLDQGPARRHQPGARSKSSTRPGLRRLALQDVITGPVEIRPAPLEAGSRPHPPTPGRAEQPAACSAGHATILHPPPTQTLSPSKRGPARWLTLHRLLCTRDSRFPSSPGRHDKSSRHSGAHPVTALPE